MMFFPRFFIVIATVVADALVMAAVTTYGSPDSIDGKEMVLAAHPNFERVLEVRGPAGSTVPFVSPVPTIPFVSPVPTVPFVSPVPTIAPPSTVTVVPFISPVPTIERPTTVTVIGSSSSESTISDTTTSNTSDHSTSRKTSSRPAASGFWSGSDPFPIITPSTFTRRSTSTSKSDDGSNISTSESSKTTSAVTMDATLTSPVLSTSTSIHVTYVTASPTTSAQAMQTLTASSTGWSITVEIDSLIVLGMIMAVQGLL